MTIATYWTSSKKNSQEDGQHSGQISSDLGYLKKGVEDINAKLEKGDERHYKLSERVGRTEESVKSAHRRLDALESKKTPDNTNQ